MSVVAINKQEPNDETIILYSELEKYNQLNAEIKELESRKTVLNKRFKKAAGVSVLKNIWEKIDDHKDHVDEFILLYEEHVAGRLDEEEYLRLKFLEKDLIKYGLDYRIIKIAYSQDHESALKYSGGLKLPINSLLADFCAQDKSTIDEEKAIKYLKNNGFSEFIKMKEIPDNEAIENALERGIISPAEFKEACVKENIVLTLTVRRNKED